MEEKQIRRAYRRDIGSYGWALVIYYILMNVCVAVAVMIPMVIQSVRMIAGGDPTGLVGQNPDWVLGNGWGYLLACLLGVLMIRVWKGKAFFAGMWQTRRNMTPGAFWGLLALFVSGQLIFQWLAAIEELILNFFGLSLMEAMELATGYTDTFSMFLYTCLFAPVVEEIIFRGLVMRGLEKYGKWFAVAASAVLFGLFHGNPAQSPYAFAVGLVLGYVAMEYNLLWAMVMHMINNLVLGDLIPRLTQGLGELGSAMVLQAVIWLCAVGAVAFLITGRDRLKAFREENPTAIGAWRGFAAAAGVIVMAIMMTVNGISMLI